ncbi:hypothetical protein AYO41_02500 [Verrucomicrobia bacterium SCGC AG-212-E04]|nr:hypothetical protein AYO41_02500 [Verrucomicrobia bacterium SCGC AG-212-E04]
MARLFQAVAEAPTIASRLAQLRERGPKAAEPVVFGGVGEAAQPFLVALLQREFPGRRIWLLCDELRAQEKLFAGLRAWGVTALFLPELELAPIPGALPDPELNAERLATLGQLAQPTTASVAVVVLKSQMADEVPPPESFREAALRLSVNDHTSLEWVADQLVAAGYKRAPRVDNRGQFSVRGGILDVYGWDQLQPFRAEWFGDIIESLRWFDLDEQKSLAEVPAVTLMLGLPASSDQKLAGYVVESDLICDVGAAGDAATLRITADANDAAEVGSTESPGFLDLTPRIQGWWQDSGVGREVGIDRGRKHLEYWLGSGYTVYVQFKNDSEEQAIQQLSIEKTKISKPIILLSGEISDGFSFADGRVVVLPAAALTGHPHSRAHQAATSTTARRLHRRLGSQINFEDFREGELVVHAQHGLARFRGFERRAAGDGETETLVLEFAQSARMFVPFEQAFLVSRYVGMGRHNAPLSRLGDARWSTARKSAEVAVEDYAARLLRIQALRETRPGFAFPPDGAWQLDFERTFPYRETPDQVTSIADTKHDMERAKPMDRLICGDVGFGKTEVAIRAAFKAALAGKQVAFLAPTTVLAQQHFEVLNDRMADFPIRIELLNRYRTPRQQKTALEGMADGSVDIAVGTHRLLSSDVTFRQLGLLVVDEEQRFGVQHKERLRELYPHTDVLTLSATPIPRTLYMALTGARDMSLLETPPANRYAVETVVCGFDERLIRDAIDRELARRGQVYFLHNRIDTIYRTAERVRELCPDARVEIGHGQMDEHELEDVMRRFVAGEVDVLVSTTIIESGLDIPNANTILIDRADRFGLADLYQLRGRVGRGSHKAYAYLFLPRDFLSGGEARRRIEAITQYSSLGAGFQIAMRDLEIRGAGSILGVAQSGHITAVGFDLYCQLLEQAVAKLKGKALPKRPEVSLQLDFVEREDAPVILPPTDRKPRHPAPTLAAGLPITYVTDTRLRIEAFRRLAGVCTAEQLKALRSEWRDRFGRLPAAADHLLALTGLKLLASDKGVSVVETKGDRLILTRAGEPIQLGGRYPRLTSGDADSKVREIADLLRKL